MSEINSFSDYASKYNTNVDYSYLFGGMQTPSTGSAFNLSDYAAIKNGSYGKLLKAYYAKQDAEKGIFRWGYCTEIYTYEVRSGCIKEISRCFK